MILRMPVGGGEEIARLRQGVSGGAVGDAADGAIVSAALKVRRVDRVGPGRRTILPLSNCNSERESKPRKGQVHRTNFHGFTLWLDKAEPHNMQRCLDYLNTEPPRVLRRLFGLSHAAMAGCSSMA